MIRGRLALTKFAKSRSFHTTGVRRLELATLITPGYELFTTLHIQSGLPWYAFIPLSTVVLRTTLTLPIAIWNRLRARRQTELQPLLTAMSPVLKAKLASSPAAQSGALNHEQITILAAKERRKRRVQLYKRYNCQIWKSVLIQPAVQFPLWLSMSMVIRAMCGWVLVDGIPIDTSLATEGALWFGNLLKNDPHAIFPGLIGAVTMMNVELNTRNARLISGNDGNSASGGAALPRVIANISRMGSIFFLVFSLQAPMAVCLYWFSSHTYSLVQNIALNHILPIKCVPASYFELPSSVVKHIGQTDLVSREVTVKPIKN
ncbi:hypothetical protein NADFUDRAFT_53453 [Nadsonia fulvescens var. elongata DSM 6958]|uniref:Membrane insertase YidC/Oxa/ALB C-terminal domain-containing protein n=1 Tax=Nadsonia fulvescens var. elongata DSM 6958 TaxID=857566 RepID=A0A1E3PD19_9ASCO|nr:hypothetical protein NADFUDRAFT_53453 [Nadsonia fulvescens var. elongata DSM 6958]